MSSDTTQHMRHFAFFTELASLEDADPSFRAVTAGLVVLRLVEAWVEDGAEVMAADSWGVRSVQAAIEDMPAGMPARALLGGVVEALTSARGGDLHAVAPRLMAYARSLELDARWTLGADVYETILAHVHPLEESDVAVNALLRRGHCLRQTGDLAGASSTFEAAADVASRAGDMIGQLRARIGEAKILSAKGNLPAADSLLEQTIARATEHELKDVRSMATHDRSFIAHLRGRYDVAVRLAYDAMRDAASDAGKDSILGDLAGSFYMLGVKTAARDAFLILAATARDQYRRWAATINLMDLSSEEGIRLDFERYRQQLAGEKLPPMLQTQFELHVGRGYQAFGEFTAARTWLERAVNTASENSFNLLLFEAEAALAKKEPTSPAREAGPKLEIPDEVNVIAAELKELRETVSV